MLNALPARKILLSTLKVWESGAGVKTVTSVRSVIDPLSGVSWILCHDCHLCQECHGSSALEEAGDCEDVWQQRDCDAP